MSSTFWKSVFISPAALGIALLLSTGAMAAPKSSGTNSAANLMLNQASTAQPQQIAATEPAPAGTSSPEVATDTIKPGDWQYTALQSVATKYGCNANLNDRVVSDVEFARGLSNCLTKVEPLLAQQPTPVTTEDVEVIKRLTQEFRAQLTEVDTRIGASEKRLAQAQANQFSTTTKLKGEAVFNVSGALSGASRNNVVLGDRVRLLFESSFTGQDKLWTRLATGNTASLGGTFTNPINTGTQVVENGANNTVSVDWLAYQFPVSNTNVYVAAFNALQADYAPTFAPYFDDFTGASGTIGAFAESSPIYKIGGGSGIGATIPVADTGLTSVSLGYFAFNANNPSNNPNPPTTNPPTPATSGGLFGQDNSIFGQLNFKLTPQLEGGLTYINSSHIGSIYNGTGVVVGTPLANSNSGQTTKANSFGLQFAYKASDKLSFNGFAMKTNASKGGAIGNQDIWSYGGGLAFPDVDGKGSLAGLFVGAQPYVSGVGSVPFHFEGFYKYKLSENISITPGLIYLTAPDQINNTSALIGVVRTTFLF